MFVLFVWSGAWAWAVTMIISTLMNRGRCGYQTMDTSGHELACLFLASLLSSQQKSISDTEFSSNQACLFCLFDLGFGLWRWWFLIYLNEPWLLQISHGGQFLIWNWLNWFCHKKQQHILKMKHHNYWQLTINCKKLLEKTKVLAIMSRWKTD